MKILILGDMEGVGGIVNWEQVSAGKSLYEEGRKLYTEEINAAVRGARAGGAKEIVVVDGHGAGGSYSFNSILPEVIEPDCEWVAHHTWQRYTELFEKGCDGVLLVGMHARANTPDGVLCHTIDTTTYRNLYFNDLLVGEVGLDAAVCGHYGVPVLLVTGDHAVIREAKALLGDGLVTVQVKKGLSRYSARLTPPVKVRKMIEEGARKALQNLSAVKPFVPAKPTTITVDVQSVDKVNEFRGKHGVEIIEPLTVKSHGRDFMEAWNQIWKW